MAADQEAKLLTVVGILEGKGAYVQKHAPTHTNTN